MKLSANEIIEKIKLFEGFATRIVIVQHPNGKKCLFEVPDGVELEPGERVLCDTCKGIAEGICISHSLTVGGNALDAVAKLTGATIPLKKVVGRYVIENFEMGEKE